MILATFFSHRHLSQHRSGFYGLPVLLVSLRAVLGNRNTGQLRVRGRFSRPANGLSSAACPVGPAHFTAWPDRANPILGPTHREGWPVRANPKTVLAQLGWHVSRVSPIVPPSIMGWHPNRPGPCGLAFTSAIVNVLIFMTRQRANLFLVRQIMQLVPHFPHSSPFWMEDHCVRPYSWVQTLISIIIRVKTTTQPILRQFISQVCMVDGLII